MNKDDRLLAHTWCSRQDSCRDLYWSLMRSIRHAQLNRSHQLDQVVQIRGSVRKVVLDKVIFLQDVTQASFGCILAAFRRMLSTSVQSNILP